MEQYYIQAAPLNFYGVWHKKKKNEDKKTKQKKQETKDKAEK